MGRLDSKRGMAFHWLDSNVFIQAKNGPYAFDIAPSFWKWLKETSDKGSIRTSTKVYGELLRGKDQLMRWCKLYRSCGLFIDPNVSTQKRISDISAYVTSKYESPFAVKFLSGADPWIIAHAMEEGGTVVTHELLSNGKEVKIPNVCEKFSVSYVPVYQAFRDLGLKL